MKTITDNADDFIEDLCTKVEKLLPHAFISRHQSNYYKSCKINIEENQILLNVDFAENYAFVVQNAPQGFHWNNNQATVFVAFAHYFKEDEIKHKGYVVISDNLNHDVVAVYTYQQLIIESLKKAISVHKISYFSDGAPQQFKNFKNVLNVYYHNIDFKVMAEWHLFPTAHGKGACDGIGGSIERAAAKASFRLSPDKQILTAVSLYEWLKNYGNYDNVEFFHSLLTEYNKNIRKLKKRFENQSRVKNLLKQHSICPLDNGKVRCRQFSGSQDFIDMKIVE